MTNKKVNVRYERQLLLKEFGTTGQDKLQHAKVLVVGAGGLGCAILPYLAGAGVGTLGIVDFDEVELTNLQRQVLYRESDIGKKKALVAAERLRDLNKEVVFNSYPLHLEANNAFGIVSEYDIIIDGTDNFSTRYLLSDLCFHLQKPYIYGSVLRFEGQLAVLCVPDPATGKTCSYRDLFPMPPKPGSNPTCNEAGVMGVMPGIIGTMQASEAIKLITGIGKPLINTLHNCDMLKQESYIFTIENKSEAFEHMPHNLAEIALFNYEHYCGEGWRDILKITRENV